MLTRRFMTVHEVAELLQVTESTVRAWIHDRDLRAIKFGRDWRVAPLDLERFLDAHANRPAEVPTAQTGFEPRSMPETPTSPPLGDE